MTDCEHLKLSYEEYALGVLEGEERAEIEAHLERGCPACTEGVARARGVVAQLAHAAPQVAPPASLRDAVVGAARESRRPWIPVWAWMAAAALLLFSVYTTSESRRLMKELELQQSRIEEQQRLAAQLARDRQRYELVLTVLSAQGTRELALEPSQPGARLPQVRAFWNEALGMVLTAEQVPAPAANRTYQLWVVPKGTKQAPVSAGIFRPEADGKVLMVSLPEAKMADAAALAITDEPAGGRPQPTTSPLWVGPVR